MIRLINDTTIGGVRHGKGSLLNLDPATEAQLIAFGAADTDTGQVEAQANPHYHFHGFAGNQTVGDEKFFDLSGVNHGIRGVNLSDAQMFASPGYASTVDPIAGATDSTIHIPNINYDYNGGEKLIVWWLGTATPEAADVPVLGDGYGTAPDQRGWRLRMTSDGKFDLALWGQTSGYSQRSDAPVFVNGELHSLAFVFNGADRTYGMWCDNVYQIAFGTVLQPFIQSTAFDTLSSNTVNIGAAAPAGAASLAGAAIKTRALVIMRLPPTYPMPTVATLTLLFQQLRSSPGKLVLASAL